MPPSRWRVAMIAVGTLVAAWLVLATTVGSVFARMRPGIAVAWSSRNAEARGNRALELFRENPVNPDWPQILANSHAALARSPSNVPAVAMLAAHADATGQAVLARRLFARSDRMSRHEPVTQTYLIEAAVSRGDITGALRHYNVALSVSRASADVLMPVLVTASADPTIARPLAALLARRPVWWEDFARRMAQTRADPGASFPILLSALRLDPARPAEQAMLTGAIARLLDAGHGQIAYAFYRRAVPGAPPTALRLRNGGFEKDNRLPPLDWDIHDGEGVNGSLQPLGAGHALFVSAETGKDNEAARQRLLLAPGRYGLAARIGSEDREGGETAVAVTCDPGGPTPLGAVRAPAGAQAGVLRATFVVPSGCAVQRLSVLVTPAEQTGRQSWVDDVSITPAS